MAASRVGYVLLCLCCCFGGLAGFFAVLQGVDAYSGGLVAGDVYHGTHHVQNAVYASYEGDAFNGQANRLEYHSEHDHAGAGDAGSTDGRKHGSGNNNALLANGEVDSEYLGNKDGANAW